MLRTRPYVPERSPRSHSLDGRSCVRLLLGPARHHDEPLAPVTARRVTLIGQPGDRALLDEPGSAAPDRELVAPPRLSSVICIEIARMG